MVTESVTRWRTAMGPQTRRHEELANLVHVGPADELGLDAVLDLIRSHPSWPAQVQAQRKSRVGAVTILRWLECFPAAGWQARWGAATDDDPRSWVETVCRSAAPVDGMTARRTEVRAGIKALIASRVVLPSYACIPAVAVGDLFPFIVKFRGASKFAEMEDIADRLHINQDQYRGPQQHFELRKVALGTCARPYATPCQHEHACIRCAVLHVDPKQRDRLVEITANLRQRMQEAHHHRWAGEARGLEVSLAAAEAKIAALDRANANRVRPTALGIPTTPTERVK